MLIASTTLLAFFVCQTGAIPAKASSYRVDPWSIGRPVTPANSPTFASSDDLIKAQSLSSEEYWRSHGWDGKVLDPSAIGTPANAKANNTLAARALGGVYLCENPDWGQPCGYAAQAVNTCINLGSDWNDKISSIGPDAGNRLTIYENANCAGASRDITWPGGSLSGTEWDNRISSFIVRDDPISAPRGVFFCDGAGWAEPCVYAKYSPEFCITLQSDWNDRISSIGPDPNIYLWVYTSSNCDNNSGYQILYNPGLSSMPAGWDNAISSFILFPVLS